VVRSRLAAMVSERRAIERALHDGVQQDLIAVSVRLQLVRRLIETNLEEAIATLGEIDHEVRKALTDLQTLANEIYPSLLDAQGLPDALRAASSAAGVRAKVEAEGLGRHPAEVEAALYFFCRAALECVAAGADADAVATVRVTEDANTLQLAVAHDGSGLEAVDPTGLKRGWIEALGGVLSVESEAGLATRLIVTVPVG